MNRKTHRQSDRPIDIEATEWQIERKKTREIGREERRGETEIQRKVQISKYVHIIPKNLSDIKVCFPFLTKSRRNRNNHFVNNC